MATTVQQPPHLDNRHDPAKPGDGRGNGGPHNLAPAGGSLKNVQYAPPPASTGIWVVLAAIGMSFAALTSALIVRKGGAPDWRHLTLPSILYLNTAVLFASSVTLELARRRIDSFMRGPRTGAAPSDWLYSTLGLGLLFCVGQYLAWRELSAQGLYLATNPSSSFFYVFTAGHGLHVLGGLAGLGRVIAKLRHSSLRKSTIDATARYWHFMDVLWFYLLVLLWMKL